jgi:hypothetical protein
MTNFAIFALIWPVIGTLLIIAFGLLLARRTRRTYERYQAEQAHRQTQSQSPTGAALSVRRPEPQIADA